MSRGGLEYLLRIIQFRLGQVLLGVISEPGNLANPGASYIINIQLRHRQ